MRGEMLLCVTAKHDSYPNYVVAVVVAGEGYTPFTYSGHWEVSKLKPLKDARVHLTIQDPVPMRVT